MLPCHRPAISSHLPSVRPKLICPFRHRLFPLPCPTTLGATAAVAAVAAVTAVAAVKHCTNAGGSSGGVVFHPVVLVADSVAPQLQLRAAIFVTVVVIVIGVAAAGIVGTINRSRCYRLYRSLGVSWMLWEFLVPWVGRVRMGTQIPPVREGLGGFLPSGLNRQF